MGIEREWKIGRARNARSEGERKRLQPAHCFTAPNFPLPLPLLAPAKEAKSKIIISSSLIGSLDL